MGDVKTIYKNTLLLGGSDFVAKILQFVILIFAARYLTVEAYGEFNFAVSLIFIGVIVADFGINTLLVREVARRKDMASKYFKHAFVLKVMKAVA